MEFKEQIKKKHKIIIIVLLICAIGVVILIAGGLVIKENVVERNLIKDENSIVGSFRYNENVKYEFKANNYGALYDGNDKYKYTYTADNEVLTLDFQNEAVQDASYTYKLKDGTLILQGGEGTTGGEYVLKKENK